jgi:hypothetical protein
MLFSANISFSEWEGSSINCVLKKGRASDQKFHCVAMKSDQNRAVSRSSKLSFVSFVREIIECRVKHQVEVDVRSLCRKPDNHVSKTLKMNSWEAEMGKIWENRFLFGNYRTHYVLKLCQSLSKRRAISWRLCMFPKWSNCWTRTAHQTCHLH